jgi:hypothetical protein
VQELLEVAGVWRVEAAGEEDDAVCADFMELWGYEVMRGFGEDGVRRCAVFEALYFGVL